jgi:L-histidine Nalpha-methyltransferase
MTTSPTNEASDPVDDRIVSVLSELICSDHSLGVIILELGTTNRIGEVLRSIRGAGGQKKHIKEGYQYVGAVAAQMWKAATADDNYPTLSWGITSFDERWGKIRKKLTEPRHYVSIGAGTGEKDRTILNHLSQLNRSGAEKLIYVPVDISTDLLKAAVRQSTQDIDKDRIRVMPIQLDITRQEALRELRAILNSLLGDTGALVSLLGNTLANFREDEQMLERLSTVVLSHADMLLLEVATTAGVTPSIIKNAEAEYDNSQSFRRFAMATLGDLTDCTLKLGKVVCEGTGTDKHL